MIWPYVLLGAVWVLAVAALVGCCLSKLNDTDTDPNYSEDEDEELEQTVARHPSSRRHLAFVPAPGSGRGQAPQPAPGPAFLPRQATDRWR